MEEMIGRLVGPYRVVRLLGSGGMGAVYLAERADREFEKQVAIKLVRPGLVTPQALERFRLERQTLAMLDHPHIVKLLDAGTTNDGVPYVIMDYVEGAQITQYCAAHKLPIVERLTLFQRVCDAVHYAHQRLLIHRDIKPSNLLVTVDGSPKLLDFGIAKLLSRELQPEMSDITGMGPRPMTLRYASPEQLRGDPLTVASDIYSLGVLLYELLTGRHPYGASRTPEALISAICDSKPDKPSATPQPTAEPGSDATVLVPTASSTGERSAGWSEELRRELEGDLDAIVLKAMHKDPLKRYASAERLSEDIRRYFQHLPVHAREGGPFYTSTKFVLRHKLGIAAAILLVVSLVAGLAATVWQANIARKERARAERRFDDVRQLANSMLFDFYDSIKDLPGSTPAQKLLVSKASDYLDRLAREAAGDRSLELELSGAYLKLGSVQGDPYMVNLGDTRGAVTSYRKAQQHAEAVLRAEPASTEARNTVGRAYQYLAGILPLVGDTAEAFAMQQKALETYTRLVAERPEDRQMLIELARCYDLLGDLQKRHGRDGRGDRAAALDNYQKALTRWEVVSSKSPEDRWAARGVALVNMKIGDVLVAGGDFAAAQEKYSQAVATARELSLTDPTSQSNKRFLAGAYRRLGASQARGGDLKKALETCREALAIHDTLSAADPKNVQARMDRAIAMKTIGDLQQESGDLAGALSSYSGVLEIVESLSEADPANVERKSQASDILLTLGRLRHKNGESTEAHRLTRKGLAIAVSLAEAADATPEIMEECARVLIDCEPADLRSPSQALRIARRAVEVTKNADASALDTLASVYFALGSRSQAIETAEKALTLLPAARLGEPSNEMRQAIEAHLAQFRSPAR
jgi:eukaryotic-like serine/threonine-protein kinase